MRRLVAVTVVAVLALAGCSSEDDGADVRSVGDDPSGSASASSPSGSGSASAPASGECPDDGGAHEAEEAGAAELHLELSDFAIAVEEDGAPAGVVVFEADNVGEAPHEVVVARLDDVASLPIGDDGLVDESDLADGVVVGELEAFAPGSSCAVALPLEAGDYVLFCNVASEVDGEVRGHAGEGMVTMLQVSAG